MTCSKLQNSFHGRWVCFCKDILGPTLKKMATFQHSKWARIMHTNEMHVTSCILRNPEGGTMCFNNRSITCNNSLDPQEINRISGLQILQGSIFKLQNTSFFLGISVADNSLSPDQKNQCILYTKHKMKSL